MLDFERVVDKLRQMLLVEGRHVFSKVGEAVESSFVEVKVFLASNKQVFNRQIARPESPIN